MVYVIRANLKDKRLIVFMGNCSTEAKAIDQSIALVEHSNIHENTSRPASFWSPAFNEYRFGDSPDDVNNKLPTSFSSTSWDDLPIAYEYKEDDVRYFFVALDEFPDSTKFAPPHTYFSSSSRVVFMFTNEKLFRISIRLIHDDRASNYKEITEAYARAVNTPTRTDGTFHYEDDRIFYYSSFQEDHTVIETILKGCVKPNGEFWNPFPNENTTEKKIVPSIQKMSYDIMISYCHQDKTICHRLHKRLLADKFKVWIDLENMYGSTIARMAEAIENSQFILICMSEKYKSSSYCQLEAEYAFKSRRCFIPLIVENGYKPNGWLGMLTGLRMYVDFTKYDFEEAYEKLMVEIERNRKEQS